MGTTRVLVVDDSAAFLWCVRALLESEPTIEIVGEATDGQEAILMARDLRPDLVLMDVRMPVMDGISATCQLKDEMPALTVILMTSVGAEGQAQAAIASGARACLVKETLLDTLLPTIREAGEPGDTVRG
jgi:DNA-binding NarL/FixJ family response regulator